MVEKEIKYYKVTGDELAGHNIAVVNNNLKYPTGDITVETGGLITNDNIHYPDDNIFLEPIEIKPKHGDIIGINKPHKKIQFDNLIKNIPVYECKEDIQTNPYKFNFTNGINTNLRQQKGPTSELILRREKIEKEYANSNLSYRNDLTENYKSYMRSGQNKFSKFGGGQGRLS